MVSSQKPYRLGKSWLFDGGLRVPFVVKYPRMIKPDSVCKSLTVNTDIYPTILELFGSDIEEAHDLSTEQPEIVKKLFAALKKPDYMKQFLE
jgi:arylsulfatase A-like enzyme